MQQSKPVHRWLFLSVAVGIISGIIIIFQSKIIATIIDRVYLHNATMAGLTTLLIGLLILIFFRATLTGFRESISFNTAKIIKSIVRENCFTQLMFLTPNQLSQLNTGGFNFTIYLTINTIK